MFTFNASMTVCIECDCGTFSATPLYSQYAHKCIRQVRLMCTVSSNVSTHNFIQIDIFLQIFFFEIVDIFVRKQRYVVKMEKLFRGELLDGRLVHMIPFIEYGCENTHCGNQFLTIQCE